jgi:alanine-glyoxylate transaminase/serine-glyoxylate transaminase/serine-pyruvate transaminase
MKPAAIGQLKPSRRLLLGPGPGNAEPRVLTAMATPLLGHLDPEFVVILEETKELLRRAFRTQNALTFPVSATGMAGMEACIVNLIEPGDRIIVCVNGVFGQRMADVAERAGAEVTTLERPWGQVFEREALAEALARVKPKVLGIVQAETSTGAWQPLEGLGDLCHQHGTLFLVDAVTALGCIPVEVDAWGIDAVYSCSQKGLSCPPGLAPVSFSAQAVEAINRRKKKVQSWYLDMTMVQRYWGEDRFYHHTAPITMIYALREALRVVDEEGLEPRWARHLRNHKALKAGLGALGLKYTAAEGHQLPQLNAVRIPDGVDDLAARKQLLTEFGIEVGGGLGDLKGKAWRIGLMGYNSRPDVVLLCLAALERCLTAQGVKLSPGAGVAAANAFYTG